MHISGFHSSAARLPLRQTPIAYTCSCRSTNLVKAKAGSFDATLYPSAPNSPAYGSIQARLQQRSADCLSNQGSMENELLWAGYSDHTEQLRRIQGQHEKMLVKLEEMQATVAQLQQQPPVSAWQVRSALARGQLLLWFATAVPANPTATDHHCSPHEPHESVIILSRDMSMQDCANLVLAVASWFAGSVILAVFPRLYQLCWAGGQLQLGHVHALGSCSCQEQHHPHGQAAAGSGVAFD